MSLPRFKDFAKGFNSLLTKDGWDLKNAAKVEAKSGDVKVNAEWEQADAATKGALALEVARATPLDTTTTVSGSIDTNGTGRGALTLKGLAKGVDVLGTYLRNDPKKPDAITVGARYRQEYVDTELSVDVLGATHNVDAAISAGKSGFFVGAHAVMSLVEPEQPKKEGEDDKPVERVKDYDFAATYLEKDLEVAVTTEKKASIINAGFMYRLNASTDIGAALKVEKVAPKAEKKSESEAAAAAAEETAAAPAEPSRKYGFVVGAAFRADGTTSKVKVDTAGDVTGSFSAPLRGAAVLTVVGKVNVVKGSSSGFGLQLALK